MISIYSTGTVTVTGDIATVTGVGTFWTIADLQEGDMFQCRGLVVPILSVDSDTQITLATAWPGVNAAGASYFAQYIYTDARALAATIALIEKTEALGPAVANAVRFNVQTLTEPQKEQARANIGLGVLATQDAPAARQTLGVNRISQLPANTWIMSANGLYALALNNDGGWGVWDVENAHWMNAPFTA
ncbi:MAG TPA: hypothetical protein VGC40_10205 [Paenirhodobacter sp.]